MIPTAAPSLSACRPGSMAPGSDPTRSVVSIRGDQDIATHAAVSAGLAEAVAFDGSDLVVDLSLVTFMDASTIGAIVAARNGLLTRSRALSIRAPSPRILELLTTCELAFLVDGHEVPAPPSRRGHAAVTPTADTRIRNKWRPTMGGSTKKVKGRAKQAAGAITGDKKLQREGKRDERFGNLENKTEDAADAVHDKVDEVIDKIADKK